jgi:hypothetical protein
MISINYPWNSVSTAGQGEVLIFLAIYGLLWLLALGRVLTRADLDPVTRLTWVIVVIFVPVVGIFLYVLVAPPAWSPRDPTRPDVVHPLAGTPWENDPGHTSGRS